MCSSICEIGRHAGLTFGRASVIGSCMRANRIVSLLPGGTEIVCALGCAERLKGRSHQCDFPPEIRALPVCTSPRPPGIVDSTEIEGTVKSAPPRALSVFEIDLEKLRQLRPDIILTQVRCDVCAVNLADLEGAPARGVAPGLRPKIISLSPARLPDLWQDIQTVAAALGAEKQARVLLTSLKERVVDVMQRTCLLKRRPAVACLDWLDPLTACGHWIPEMVDFAGGRNLFGQAGQPSTSLEWETLRQGDPDLIVLMPCGLDLEQTRSQAAALAAKPEWKTVRAVRSGQVFLVDGNSYFNRPGPRLVDSLEILTQIIQPVLFPAPGGGKGWEKL